MWKRRFRVSSVLFLILFIAFIVSSISAADEEVLGHQAEDSGKFRMALGHYVAALQSTPEGSAKEQQLQEEIIKLVQKIHPPPAVPEETQKHLGRGKATVEIAKKSEDLLEAISEFKKAARLAPWLANIYFNLGLVQEMADRFNDAIQSYKLYLLASPAAADAQDVKAKIYGLELKAERQQKEEHEKAARIKREQQKQEVLERFKSLVQRNIYKVSVCSWRELPKLRSGEIVGCNETEYGGRNWYPVMSMGSFHFTPNGKILLCNSGGDTQSPAPCSPNSALIIGTVEEININNIRWTNNDGKPVWIRIREDWSSFTISFNRPPDDRGYDSSYRYGYYYYKKR
jgi:tetratricopeptide (TPR) repeat protein